MRVSNAVFATDFVQPLRSVFGGHQQAHERSLRIAPELRLFNPAFETHYYSVVNNTCFKHVSSGGFGLLILSRDVANRYEDFCRSSEDAMS